MKRRLTRRTVWFIAAVTLCSLWSVADAAYPDKPIKMIVPWAAGGDTDAIARLFGSAMEKQLGQPLVAVNVTGASGTVGAREVKGGPSDGYTILHIHDSIHTTFHTGVSNIGYADFEPICLQTSTPAALAAYGRAPWNTMQELIADAKKRPEQITLGATLGSTSHFFPALIAEKAGIKWKYVTYEGTAPRMTALLGG
ncbi:MAG: tripartite tricarboxylate transporter substrate binding protein, partial [Zetaproteobacteria bacterium]